MTTSRNRKYQLCSKADALMGTRIGNVIRRDFASAYPGGQAWRARLLDGAASDRAPRAS
jgi:hypothetical protein